MGLIYEELGSVLCVAPDAYDSTTILASDNDNGIAIKGVDSVLYQIAVGDMGATSALSMQVMYSSTGAASDASASTAVWAASDAVATADSDSSNTMVELEVDLTQKGLNDEAGALFVQVTLADSNDFGIIAQVRHRNAGLLPDSLHDATVTLANATA